MTNSRHYRSCNSNIYSNYNSAPILEGAQMTKYQLHQFAVNVGTRQCYTIFIERIASTRNGWYFNKISLSKTFRLLTTKVNKCT